jgi:hypothetical protein
MEAGTHSIWISEQLQELGHEVIMANVRELRAASRKLLLLTGKANAAILKDCCPVLAVVLMLRLVGYGRPSVNPFQTIWLKSAAGIRSPTLQSKPRVWRVCPIGSWASLLENLLTSPSCFDSILCGGICYPIFRQSRIWYARPGLEPSVTVPRCVIGSHRSCNPPTLSGADHPSMPSP